jgi:hypothetical protein
MHITLKSIREIETNHLNVELNLETSFTISQFEGKNP